MTEKLNERGIRVGQRRVGRLMRQNGIQVIRLRKFKRTTNRRLAGHALHAREGCLSKQLSADFVRRL